MADSSSITSLLQNPSGILTVVFALALIAGAVVRYILATRQIRHVARNRGTVPPLFESTISLASHQKAADYTIAKTRIGMIELALGTVVIVAWTLLGGLHFLNRALTGLLGAGLWQELALIVSFVLIGALIDLPLSLYQTFVIEEKFGFNKMTSKLWFADALKSAAVGAVIGLPIAALILWLMGAAGTYWWFWAWATWTAFNLVLLVVYPAFIAPLFNKFKPLEDEEIKQRVTRLMDQCGFSAKGLYVMDGSTRSAHANAYFTGFGAAKRVVFYDTLLARLSPDQIDAVLAHELGHFKHKHIIKRIVAMFSISLAGFALLGWLSTQTWFYTGLGVQPNIAGPNDAIALLLFMTVMPVFGFFVSPLFAQLSRKHEFEADAYAVSATGTVALPEALLKLYEDNASTLTPDPVYASFYYSHPPASERLARMNLKTA